jgi:murein DD-endopeptidase MepM/ murein hydrolase activator NlpD
MAIFLRRGVLFMVRITLKSFVTLLSGGLLFFLVGFPLAYGQSSSPDLGQPQAELLDYRLRQGEALGDVARLFRIPVAELVQLNGISDPTRLQVGQALKIPNIFVRQVTELQRERTRLLAEKVQLAQQLREVQHTLTKKEHVLRRTEASHDALAQELAAVGQWRRGAQVLSIVLLGVFSWGLLINKDRAGRGRQIATLRQENTALEVAKEKYRLVATQLEFRYQKLYSGRSEKPSQLATEGATFLTQTFATGCAQLEHYLSAIKTEREKEEQLLQSKQRIFDFLRHPFRELHQRYRLRYHSA